MDCREVRELIQDLLDDRLPADARRDVEDHLETCAACATERDEIARTIDLVRSLPRESAPSSFAADVMAGVSSRPAPRGRRLSFPLALLGSVAAAALLLVAVLALVPEGVLEPDDVMVSDRREADERLRTRESAVADEIEEDARPRPESAVAAREEARSSRREAGEPILGKAERKDGGRAASRPAAPVLTVRVSDPRALEKRVRRALSAPVGNLEGASEAEEALDRVDEESRRAGDRSRAGARRTAPGRVSDRPTPAAPRGPARPASAPPADGAAARESPHSGGGAGGAPGEDRDVAAREGFSRVPAAGPGPVAREIVLTPRDVACLLAILGEKAGPEADAEEGSDDAPPALAMKKAKDDDKAEADARTLLAALLAARGKDGHEGICLRLLVRTPAATARPDAGR